MNSDKSLKDVDFIEKRTVTLNGFPIDTISGDEGSSTQTKGTEETVCEN